MKKGDHDLDQFRSVESYFLKPPYRRSVMLQNCTKGESARHADVRVRALVGDNEHIIGWSVLSFQNLIVRSM